VCKEYALNADVSNSTLWGCHVAGNLVTAACRAQYLKKPSVTNSTEIHSIKINKTYL
jgi:hypothetical protein